MNGSVAQHKNRNGKKSRKVTSQKNVTKRNLGVS